METVSHKAYLKLAVPFTLSTVTQPPLGAVDTAVVGRLGSPSFIGGVAIGTVELWNSVDRLFISSHLTFEVPYWSFRCIQIAWKKSLSPDPVQIPDPSDFRRPAPAHRHYQSHGIKPQPCHLR